MINKLSPNLKKLHSHLMDLTENVHEDIVLSVLLAKLSQASVLNRVKSYAMLTEVFTNMYVINFIPSGSGKDKTKNKIDKNLFTEYYKTKAFKVEEYKKKVNYDLKHKAQDLELTDKQTQKFINENSPRDLSDVVPTATVEGFEALRLAYEKAGFGGTMAIISEFSDYILHNKTENEIYLTAIKEVYETGDSYGKIIKKEKESKSIKGVPNVALFQSTATGLDEHPGSEKMKAFLNKGLARRSLICYPDPDNLEKKDLSYDEYEEFLKKVERNNEEMQNIISRMVKINPNKNVFYFTRESEEYLYNIKKKTEYFEYKGKIESLVADVRSRPRKIQRLAGLVALVEHPVDTKVYIEDLQVAESIINHYAKYLNKFIEKLYEDDLQKLINYLKDNEGAHITKTDIRKQKFVHKNKFKSWFEDAIEEVKPLLLIEGYLLTDEDVGSIGKKYLLKKIK